MCASNKRDVKKGYVGLTLGNKFVLTILKIEQANISLLKEEHSDMLQKLKISYEAATGDIISRLENDHASRLNLEKEQAFAQIEIINQSRQAQINNLQVKT